VAPQLGRWTNNRAQLFQAPSMANERKPISARNKAALAGAKARGVKLGGPKLKQAQRRGVASNKANADRFAANVLPVIQQIKASGVTSLRAIAKVLNARGIATARGGVWTPVQVTAMQRRASLTK
jgi:DNA invertase Pin-like site-specific DNA recombinase